MAETIKYREYAKMGLDEGQLSGVRAVVADVHKILEMKEIIDGIHEVHKFGASSAKVQAVLLAHLERLGFTSERKGLFKEMNVSGIRPDYFKALPGGGILFEVERGKTIANNMDLLDVWKTHICQEAQHLFLLVPNIRMTEKNKEQKIFASVEKRVGTFFLEQTHPIDVESVHLFGY
jgi:hypothetical protein